MNGATLHDAISMASTEYPFAPYDYSIHLNWPLGKKFPFPLSVMKANQFKIRVYGYPGIKRRGYAPGYNNSSWLK